MALPEWAVEALGTIVRTAFDAYKRGDVDYLKRAAADAAAWEVERRALDAAKKKVKR